MNFLNYYVPTSSLIISAVEIGLFVFIQKIFHKAYRTKGMRDLAKEINDILVPKGFELKNHLIYSLQNNEIFDLSKQIRIESFRDVFYFHNFIFIIYCLITYIKPILAFKLLCIYILLILVVYFIISKENMGNALIQSAGLSQVDFKKEYSSEELVNLFFPRIDANANTIRIKHPIEVKLKDFFDRNWQ